MIYWILLAFAILTATIGIFISDESRATPALVTSAVTVIIMVIMVSTYMSRSGDLEFAYTPWIIIGYGMITASISFLSGNSSIRRKSGWVAFICAAIFAAILLMENN